MIEAEFLRRDKTLTGFCVQGHAGFDDAGKDIVCAAVTSALQLTANTITEEFLCKADVLVLENEIRFQLQQNSPEAVKILDGFYKHLSILEQDFPGTIQITFSEV